MIKKTRDDQKNKSCISRDLYKMSKRYKICCWEKKVIRKRSLYGKSR
jgi:hypothetical protein